MSVKKNGLDAANAEPAKTITKRTSNFIATLGRALVADGGHALLGAALLAQAVLVALGGVL